MMKSLHVNENTDEERDSSQHLWQWLNWVVNHWGSDNVTIQVPSAWRELDMAFQSPARIQFRDTTLIVVEVNHSGGCHTWLFPVE